VLLGLRFVAFARLLRKANPLLQAQNCTRGQVQISPTQAEWVVGGIRVARDWEELWRRCKQNGTVCPPAPYTSAPQPVVAQGFFRSAYHALGPSRKMT
jgi:hypothetical protein